MKPYHALLPLTLLIAVKPLAAQQAPPPQVIDDRQIKTRFEKLLGALRDDEKTPRPDELQQQLKERKHHALELPQIALSQPAQTSAVYGDRKQSVLCFGHIYKCDNCNKWHGNLAGGFVITADGIAVTNYHVMESAKAGAFGAMTFDGKVHLVEEVLAASERDDLAIVRLAGEGFEPTPIGSNASVGSPIVAISHPQGRFYTVSEGILSRYYKHTASGSSGGAERLAITADFAKGSSGCPVFSTGGAVIGVVSSTISIYYDRDKNGIEKNLQMVIKSCIPSAAILKLLSAPANAAAAQNGVKES
jgi:serine protease Do